MERRQVTHPGSSGAPTPTDRAGAASQLSFALYGAANRMVRMHKPFLEPIGLTFPQYLVLLELFAASPRSVGEIGGKLGMDAGTITPLLKRLAASGKVTRLRDTADERRVLIHLTPDGAALRAAVQAVSGQIRTACKLDAQGAVSLQHTLESFALPPFDPGDANGTPAHDISLPKERSI